MYGNSSRHLLASRSVRNGQQIGQSMNEAVHHPKHYTSHPSGLECIEITRHMGFNLGNAMKYIWRDGLKDMEVPTQDLEKAIWYIQDEINMRKGESLDEIKIKMITTCCGRPADDKSIKHGWRCLFRRYEG